MDDNSTMSDIISNAEALKTASEAARGFFKYCKRFKLMRKPEYYEMFYYGVKPYFEKRLGSETEEFFAAENEFYYRVQKNKKNILSLAELDDIIENVKTTVFINHLKR